MSIFLNSSTFSYKVAAPSWVIPGTVAENCRFLDGRVDEVALLFFETKSCLAYTVEDLPHDLNGLGLSFHIHHPLDLPWDEGGERVAQVVLALNEKAAHLSPQAHVVHPPAAGKEAGQLLRDFATAVSAGGIAVETVLFENIKENSLLGLVETIRQCGMKICLDLGHILAYAQHGLLREEQLFGLVRMVHLNAPGKDGRHLGLDQLDRHGFETIDVLLSLIDKDGVVTIEVFEENLFSSRCNYSLIVVVGRIVIIPCEIFHVVAVLVGNRVRKDSFPVLLYSCTKEYA